MRIFPITAFLLLAACAVGPDYHRPKIEIPVSYKEAYGTWRQANPQDAEDRGAWWSVYRDPVLDGLEKRVDVSNENLKAAAAVYREASAMVEETRASLFPTVTVDASAGRMEGTMPIPMLPNSLYGAASWEPDVWGRIRRNLESSEANAEASADDLASARLSMQAMLAMDYFDLRAQDELKRLLDAMAIDDKTILGIVQYQYDTGTGALSEVLAAKTRFENAESKAVNAGIQRAKLEHAIAVLIGNPPAEFSLLPGDFIDKVPDIPPGLPSALLERRPDIAAAERRVAAANAQIGVATTAWFPDFMLMASSGYASMLLNNLVQPASDFWEVGPALAETVFDAGARQDRVDQARAAYDKTAALYRQTVLTAFREVEDNLAALRLLADQRKMQETSVANARLAEQLAQQEYTSGVGSYRSFLAAQTARIDDGIVLLAVRRSRLDAGVALIEALGGGWNVLQLPGSR